MAARRSTRSPPSGPSSTPTLSRLSTSASISVPGSSSRSSLAICRVASTMKVRWFSNAVSDRSARRGTHSRGPASRSISSQTTTGGRIDQATSSPAQARAPRRRHRRAELLSCWSPTYRDRDRAPIRLDGQRRYADLGAIQQLAADVAGNPTRPARCSISGFGRGAVRRTPNHRHALGAQRTHDRFEAGRHHSATRDLPRRIRTIPASSAFIRATAACSPCGGISSRSLSCVCRGNQRQFGARRQQCGFVSAE